LTDFDLFRNVVKISGKLESMVDLNHFVKSRKKWIDKKFIACQRETE
jgi:hypothetical protein